MSNLITTLPLSFGVDNKYTCIVDGLVTVPDCHRSLRLAAPGAANYHAAAT